MLRGIASKEGKGRFYPIFYTSENRDVRTSSDRATPWRSKAKRPYLETYPRPSSEKFLRVDVLGVDLRIPPHSISKTQESRTHGNPTRWGHKGRKQLRKFRNGPIRYTICKNTLFLISIQNSRSNLRNGRVCSLTSYRGWRNSLYQAGYTTAIVQKEEHRLLTLSELDYAGRYFWEMSVPNLVSRKSPLVKQFL